MKPERDKEKFHRHKNLEITYKPIGIIHSPFSDIPGMPIQSAAARGIKGFIELNPNYTAGLKDLAGFSHIMLLYHFHRSKGYALHIRPFLDKHIHGVFATRAPRRPNPIGLSIVKLLHVKGNRLDIEEVDILDGTPLLDIKPYVPAFDAKRTKRIGWLAKKVERANTTTADTRFTARHPGNYD